MELSDSWSSSHEGISGAGTCVWKSDIGMRHGANAIPVDELAMAKSNVAGRSSSNSAMLARMRRANYKISNHPPKNWLKLSSHLIPKFGSVILPACHSIQFIVMLNFLLVSLSCVMKSANVRRLSSWKTCNWMTTNSEALFRRTYLSIRNYTHFGCSTRNWRELYPP